MKYSKMPLVDYRTLVPYRQLHGTYRKKDRVYREEFFYGQGKSLDEVTEGELAQDLAERESENPLAYDNNQYAYELKRSDVKKRTQKSQK